VSTASCSLADPSSQVTILGLLCGERVCLIGRVGADSREAGLGSDDCYFPALRLWLPVEPQFLKLE
jgi:hypothetical protein